MQIIRKTIEKDEAYLRQISATVDFSDKNLLKELDDLKTFAGATECFALAAVQIGIPKRIIYLKNTDPNVSNTDMTHDESKILINPRIVSRKGHTKYWEACLSCLDNAGLVSRPFEMTLDYWDTNGVRRREKFQGFESTVLMHELDHLDGILHMDIAEQVRVLPVSERIKLRESEPYVIISKDCDFKPSRL